MENEAPAVGTGALTILVSVHVLTVLSKWVCVGCVSGVAPARRPYAERPRYYLGGSPIRAWAGQLANPTSQVKNQT